MVLLLAAYLLRNILIGPWLLDYAEPIVADALGGSVELDGTSGSWLTSIGIARARSLEDGTKTPLRAFDLVDLELQFSLWDLVQGRMEGLQSIRASRLEVAIDQRAILKAEDEEETEASDPAELPAGLPQIQIDALQFSYQDAETDAALRDGVLHTNAQGQLELAIAKVEFERNGQVAPPVALATTLDYANGVLRVPSLRVNEVEHVEHLKLDLSRAVQREIEFDLAVNVLEGRIEAAGALRQARLRSTLLAEGLIAEELEPWLDLGLRGELDVEGRVDFPLQQPELARASFRFGAQQNAWRQVELAAINGEVELEQGWLTSPSLTAQGPGLDLEAVDCAFPLFAEDAETRATRGSIALRVDDVPAWVRRLEVELPAESAVLRSLEIDASVASTAAETIVQLDRGLLQTELGPVHASGMVRLLDLQLASESDLKLRVDTQDVSLEQLEAWLTETGLVLPPNLPPSGALSLALGVDGTAAQPRAFLSLQARDVMPPADLADVPPGPYQTQLDLTFSEGQFTVEPLLVTGPHLELTLRAQHGVDLDLAALSRGELPQLDGQASANLELRADPHAHVEGVAVFGAQLEALLDEAGLPLISQLDWTLSSEAIAVREQPFAVRGLAASGSAKWLGLEAIPESLTQSITADELHIEELPSHRLETELAYADQRLQLSGHLLGALAPLRWQAAAPLTLDDPTQLPDGELQLLLESDVLQVEQLLQVAEKFGVEIELDGEVHDATGTLQLAVEGGGTWQDPRLRVRLDGSQLLLRPRNAELKSLLPSAMQLAADWRLEGQEVRLVELTATAEEVQIAAGGSWVADAPLFATARSGGSFDGLLDLQGSAQIPDTSWLATMPGIRRIGGSVEANFSIQGPQSTPQIAADWALHGGELRLDNPALAAFDRLEFAGSFDGKQLQLTHCHGELGSAPFTATGTVQLAEVEHPVVDVQLQGSDLLLFRRQGVKLRSDTGLHIHGPLNALRADGELALTDGRYTKPVDFILPLLRKGQPPGNGVEGISLFSLGAPLDTMQFNVHVKPGNGFRIKTNVANGMLRPDVRLVGTGEVPYLQGEIYLDRTILSMPAHRITIEQGVIRFTEENPFVPSLDILAGFRRYGYDVTIVVEGDILEPIITMSSVPPLEAEDLLLFTTTGQPPQEAANAQEALGTVAVYLAQDWLRRFFGDLSTEEEESLFDRIEIEFGRDSTNQGAETIEGRFLLRRDNFLENDALFLTGERDAYSDFNLGVRLRFLFP